MTRINVLTGRKLYGLSINNIEGLFSEIKSTENTCRVFKRPWFFIFSKEIPKNLY